MIYPLLRRALFQLAPEKAHTLSTDGLDLLARLPGGATALRALAGAASKPVRVFGLDFPNPVGLAAGFDKNAEHVDALCALGFGFIEIGSVTARPCEGNPQPRLFRLPADGALINRMGLNNQGADAVAGRLMRVRERLDRPLFVNVAKTPDSDLEGDAAIADYVASVRRLKAFADVMVLNVSCPNSGDGRTFEAPEALEPLVAAVLDDLDGLRPLVVKLSPDLSDDQLRAAVRCAHDLGVAGFTATNTTVARAGLHTTSGELERIGRGGLSGAPLHARAVQAVRVVSQETDRPVIGVGGVQDAPTAQALLDAGATLVQLYTGFVYGGPRTVHDIVRGLR